MPALLRGPPKAGGPASRDTQSQPSPGSQTDQSPCHDSSSAACWAVPCPIHARPGNLWPQESPPRLPPWPQGSSPKSSLASGVGQGVLSLSSPSPFFLPSPTSLVTVPPAPPHPGSALSNVWSPLVYSQRFVEHLLHSRPRSGCGGLSSE